MNCQIVRSSTLRRAVKRAEWSSAKVGSNQIDDDMRQSLGWGRERLLFLLKTIFFKKKLLISEFPLVLARFCSSVEATQ